MLRVVVRESMTEDLIERLIVDILQIVEAFMDGECRASVKLPLLASLAGLSPAGLARMSRSAILSLLAGDL